MVTYVKTLEDYDLNQLQTEINSNATIIPSLLYITAEGDQLSFEFASALDTMEESTLDQIIANHVPIPPSINLSELPISPDTNKLAVQSSAKPMLTNKTTYAVWTGAGDDPDTGETGGGELLDFEITVGTSSVSKDVIFHPLNGQVWINEAYIRYEGAGQGDFCSGIIMAPATALQQLSNLDLVVENNWVKYSSGGAGTGTHGFAATPVLIPRTYSQDGDWDFDGVNLLPNLSGSGAFKISDIEQSIHKFVSTIPCRGTTGTYFNLASDDTAELLHPYFIRVTFHNSSNTNWNAQVFLEIYRERTMVP